MWATADNYMFKKCKTERLESDEKGKVHYSGCFVGDYSIITGMLF